MPVALAISKVFLTVHGVEREDAIAKAHGGDQRLRGGDLVRFVVDHLMRENDLMVDGEGAKHMRGFAIGESVEALPQRLSVDSDEAGRRGGAATVETFRMTAKRLLELIGIELSQDSAHGGVGGWRSSQGGVWERRIEHAEPAWICGESRRKVPGPP